MITEDYVSFETAKLLKEKGFDENCSRSYVKDKLAVSQGFNNSYYTTMYSDGCYRPISAPTLQMAMKWLREKYNIHIEPRYFQTSNIYRYVIIHSPIRIENIDSRPQYFNTYKEACEAAIKHCLETLI